MAYILEIETATEICSVAISSQEKVLVSKIAEGEYEHAKQITILIQQCLQDIGLAVSDLAAVAVSQGPGSYTGLRIGASVAKGICYSNNIPLISVDTLRAIAFGAARETKQDNFAYLPMIDARRMEVYCALYDRAFHEIDQPKAIIVKEDAFTAFTNKYAQIIICGNGAEKCKSKLTDPTFTFIDTFCHAAYLAPFAAKKFQEGNFQSVAYFKPFYLKPPNITKPKNTF